MAGFGVIFDMDGVLLNTIPANKESFRVILARHGVNLGDEDFVQFNGRSLRDQVEAFNQHFGTTLKFEDVLLEHNEFQRQAWNKTPLVPPEGLLQLLDVLASDHIPMGVGTSSRQQRAFELLTMTAIRQYFDAVVTADDVIKHKPNPDIFLEAARRLGLPPSDCVVLEDAGNGVEAAKRGGMKAIGLFNGFNEHETFAGADLTIHGFGELNTFRLSQLWSD